MNRGAVAGVAADVRSGSKADIGTQSSNVRFVPKADMWRCINSANSRELTLGGNEMTNSSTSHTISPEHIMQIGLGFWASKTLLSAVSTC
jgi:hypothetical protein